MFDSFSGELMFVDFGLGLCLWYWCFGGLFVARCFVASLLFDFWFWIADWFIGSIILLFWYSNICGLCCVVWVDLIVFDSDLCICLRVWMICGLLFGFLVGLLCCECSVCAFDCRCWVFVS